MRLSVSYGRLVPLGKTSVAGRRQSALSIQQRVSEREGGEIFRAILDGLTPFCSAMKPIAPA